MILSLFLLCVAASAVIAFATSALSALALQSFASKLGALAAAAQARVLFGIALLPALACVSMMTAALAPSFGWIVDHCTESADVHMHPHICFAHHVSEAPAGPLVALGALLLLNLGIRWTRLFRAGLAVLSTNRVLRGVSERARDGAFQVLPFDEPQAFVIGALRPELFVSRGLLSVAYRAHLEPVLSHERAHIRRRDPLRRLVSSIALGFHLPGVAGWLERKLSRAHEMAADADAAREMRSPERVAAALVELTRAKRRTLALALAFAGSDVEARVAMLLDRNSKPDRPQPIVLLAGLALLLAAVGSSADAVHHGVEMAVGLLGG